MQTTLSRRPLPAISAAGNGEERAAQIKSIQARVERIRRAHHQITADVNQLTDDVDALASGTAPVIRLPAKDHN